MIHYNKHRYNCAHHAVNRLNEINGTDIHFSNGDEWQSSFVLLLKDLFVPIRAPKEGCLVVLGQYGGGSHLGVFTNGHVEHNYKPSDSAGCVIKSDLGTIRSEYKRVRFYAVTKAISH